MALAVNDNYDVDIKLSDRNLDDLLSVWSLAVLAGRITVLDRATTSVSSLHVQTRAPPTKQFCGFRSAEIWRWQNDKMRCRTASWVILG